ncbi:hypothetical protein M407DRAFT_246588, partial [Tulasnella calospora MUT 4182]
ATCPLSPCSATIKAPHQPYHFVFTCLPKYVCSRCFEIQNISQFLVFRQSMKAPVLDLQWSKATHTEALRMAIVPITAGSTHPSAKVSKLH